MSDETKETYREYIIKPNDFSMTPYDKYHYEHKDFDGPEDNRYGYAGSIQACKNEIDEYYD